MIARPVIEDNGLGSAIVTADAIYSGSVSVTKYWRRWLFTVAGQIGDSYTYTAADELKAITYVEEHLDSSGVKTIMSSRPLFVQDGVGTPTGGGEAPTNPGGGGDGDTTKYTDFDFTLGVEPPGASISDPDRFTTSSAYTPGLVTTAPKVGFSPAWANLGGAPSLTENYSQSPNGDQTATRMVVPAGNANVGLRHAMSGLTPGQHTNHIWIKSNTGVNQNVFFRSLADSNYQVLAATPNWQRFHTVGNIASNWFSFDLAATGDSLDISVWGMDFFTGDESGRDQTGSVSYLDLLTGQSVQLNVPEDSYDVVITSDTNTTDRIANQTIGSGQIFNVPGPRKIKRVQFVDVNTNTGGGNNTGDGSGTFGGYVDPDPNYVPSTQPSDTVRVLMSPTDTPYKIGPLGNGWHRYATVTQPGFSLPHARILGSFPASNLDDAGFVWGRIAQAGRHNYDYDRAEESKTMNGGCPKILAAYLTPKWGVSAAHQQEIRNRYGNENSYGQIHGAGRWPSYPYGPMPPENWEYLAEYIRWCYRPKDVDGPGAEPFGAGFTVDSHPVVEYSNEQKFGDVIPNSTSRWWDHPYSGNPPRAFNLHTFSELAIGCRVCKENVPAGVKVSVGGWEGDSQGKTIANPNAAYSFFQAWALSSDGAGGIGIDHVDVVFFHPYMYNYDPARMQFEIDGYRAQLEWLAVHLGRPEIADIIIHANETGHEATTGVDGQYGTGSWIIDNQGQAGYDTLARNMKRTTLLAIGNASRQKCVGITHYNDVPHTRTFGKSNGRQTYGSPSENVTLSQAGLFCNQVIDRVVRQAVIRSDGRAWVEFEGGLLLEA